MISFLVIKLGLSSPVHDPGCLDRLSFFAHEQAMSVKFIHYSKRAYFIPSFISPFLYNIIHFRGTAQKEKY